MASYALRPFRSALRTEARRPRPSPVTIRGSAVPGSPSGVAKTILWPRPVSTSQGTPVSVGSKSRVGSGMRIVAMAQGSRVQPRPVDVESQLADGRAAGDRLAGHAPPGASVKEAPSFHI